MNNSTTSEVQLSETTSIQPAKPVEKKYTEKLVEEAIKNREAYKKKLIEKIEAILSRIDKQHEQPEQVGGGGDFIKAFKNMIRSNRIASETPTAPAASAASAASAAPAASINLTDLPIDMLEEISKYLDRDEKINLRTALPSNITEPSLISKILTKDSPVNSYLAYTIYIALIRYINSYLNLVVKNEIKALHFDNPNSIFKINGNYIILNISDISDKPEKLVIMYYLTVSLRNNIKNYILKYKIKVANSNNENYNFKEEDTVNQIVLKDAIMDSINDVNNVNIFINNINNTAAAASAAATITFDNIEFKSANNKNQIYEAPYLVKFFSTEKKEKKLFLDALSNTANFEFIKKLIDQNESLNGLSENIQKAAAIAAEALKAEAVDKALAIEAEAKAFAIEEAKAKANAELKALKTPSNVYDNPILARITEHLVAKHPKKALIYLQYLMFILYDKCNIRDTQKILKTVNNNLNILDIFNLENIDDIVDMVGFYSPNPDIPKIPVPTLRTFVRKYNEVINNPNSDANLICAYGIDIYSKETEAKLKAANQNQNPNGGNKIKKKRKATIKKQ